MNQTSDTISFLSWNLCLLERSDDAPVSWRVDQTEALVRERILGVSPDFVFFQELPGLVPFVETHDLIPANTKSHSGDIATLIKRELADSVQSVALGGFAVLTAIPKLDLTVANVHLAPSVQGNFNRLDMLSKITRAVTTRGLLIAGDTNTRVKEEPMIESLGLTGARPPRPTWDTNRNGFRSGGRKYSAYFTRHFSNQFVTVSSARVWDEPFEQDGYRFHVSDHFALSAKATIRVPKITDQ